MSWWRRRKPPTFTWTPAQLDKRTHRYVITPKGVACTGCGCRSWQHEATIPCPNPGPQPKENT